ncbi:MAG: adenylate/guanylate cyclase domain-containing protein [Longimicrobiales bacterium]
MVRQLTAIMFTDMVGYTALMQEDERQAKLNRDRHREVLEATIPAHGGRILQYYGDGTLSVFDSAVGAVLCGVEIQGRFQSLEPAVPVRIGVHTGDVVHDADGVFGDGVNVAARIQGLSVPGGLLISGKVHDEVKNQDDIGTVSLGTFNLKHVKRPMEVYAVTGHGLRVPAARQLDEARVRNTRSIAVLPFVNMSSDPENEFFSDGITEEVINALTRVNGLQVTARTSSFAFKNRNGDVRDIAEQLGVTHVLEGSVRRAGSRVRVTAQLIEAREGYHLFSDVYDRRLEDIFAVQDEISDAIVRQLATHLDPDGGTSERRHSRGHSHDTEAYAEYLRGRFHWSKWTPEGARLALSHYRRSIEMDPQCALPYSGLATAHVFLGSIGHAPPHVAFPAAEAAARRALELEPDAGESHLALAAVQLFHDWDWDAAYRSFQKAISLTPGSSDVHQIYAVYLQTAGEYEEAVDVARTAVELDPLSLPANHTLANALLSADRLEEAEEQAQLCLVMDPAFRSATEALGFVRIAQGRLQEALAYFEQLPLKAGKEGAAAAPRGYTYALMGRTDDAHRMLALLEERARSEEAVSLHADFAFVYMGLGDYDAALRQLQAAVDLRVGFAVFMKHSPIWKDAPIRKDPRFATLLRQIGAPEPVLA